MLHNARTIKERAKNRQKQINETYRPIDTFDPSSVRKLKPSVRLNKSREDSAQSDEHPVSKSVSKKSEKAWNLSLQQQLSHQRESSKQKKQEGDHQDEVRESVKFPPINKNQHSTNQQKEKVDDGKLIYNLYH